MRKQKVKLAASHGIVIARKLLRQRTSLPGASITKYCPYSSCSCDKVIREDMSNTSSYSVIV